MSSPSIPIDKALALSIEELQQPVITIYELALIVFKLYLAKNYRYFKLRIKKATPTSREFRKAIDPLVKSDVLKPSKDFRGNKVFEIFGRKNPDVAEIACVVDPFAYLSHLSAMSYHGLTDRLPRTLFLSSPPSSLWRAAALDRMKKDYGSHFQEFSDTTLPRLSRIPFKKIQSTLVECHNRTHLGAFRLVKNRSIRISTIGRTFLDMLREPQWCGGIEHVLNVFEEHAKRYLRLIVDEVDRHGNSIDKARAGYVLEERCNLTDPVIDKWAQSIQRGGSRKLNPSEEYSPRYSGRWSISLNVAERKDVEH